MRSEPQLLEVLGIIKTIKQSDGFHMHAGLISKGIFDSFDIMRLVDCLEKEYGLTIPGEEITIDNLDSAEAIVGLVKKMIVQKNI